MSLKNAHSGMLSETIGVVKTRPLLREGFQSASKWKTRTSHIGEQNSTRFIEVRHTKLDKAVCIYAVFSHT